MAMDRVRNTAPEVISYSPVMENETDSINCTTPIVLNFNWDMDTESVQKAFSIDPPVEGNITFEDSQYRMVFTPTRPYEVATLYTVKLDKSAKHPGNMSMAEDFSFTFLTQGRNQLKLLAASPSEGAVLHYPKPTIEVRFDNVLDPVNIRDLIKLQDSEGNDVSINLRSAKYNQLGDSYGNYYFTTAADLKQGQNYKLKIDASLHDVENIAIVDPIEINFTAGDVSRSETAVEEFETPDMITFDATQSIGTTTAKRFALPLKNCSVAHLTISHTHSMQTKLTLYSRQPIHSEVPLWSTIPKLSVCTFTAIFLATKYGCNYPLETIHKRFY